jgi:hypothetical protein
MSRELATTTCAADGPTDNGPVDATALLGKTQPFAPTAQPPKSVKEIVRNLQREVEANWADAHDRLAAFAAAGRVVDLATKPSDALAETADERAAKLRKTAEEIYRRKHPPTPTEYERMRERGITAAILTEPHAPAKAMLLRKPIVEPDEHASGPPRYLQWQWLPGRHTNVLTATPPSGTRA